MSYIFYRQSANEVSLLTSQLQNSSSFEEWERCANQLDSLLGNDLWRQNPNSKKYDFRLISTRLKQLVSARENENVNLLIRLLRSGLLRNLGSMCNMDLYNRAYSGTKVLIEDYIAEIIQCLEYLDTKEINKNYYRVIDQNATSFATMQQKMDFFHNTRQSFGRTVLVLHGGSLFGLCHLGVIKSLFLNGLLPRIISGATVGALVAAYICCLRDDELLKALDNISKELPVRFTARDAEIKYYSNFERILKSLYPPEIILFERYVSHSIENMTFEEAYLKTNRVLNITVTPSELSLPKLFNYLTTPNVIIRSAVNASIGTGILYKNVELLAKDHLGNVVSYPSLMMPKNRLSKASPITFKPSNLTMYSDRESPYTKLSELFNINNFIISSARPYLAPLLLAGESNYRGHGGFLPRLSKVVKLDIQHRLHLLATLGMLPNKVHRVFVDENIPQGKVGSGGMEVTLVPELPSIFQDLGKVFDTQEIPEKVEYCIKLGEKSVWPNLQIIWARCAIEFVLDDLYQLSRK